MPVKKFSKSQIAIAWIVSISITIIIIMGFAIWSLKDEVTFYSNNFCLPCRVDSENHCINKYRDWIQCGVGEDAVCVEENKSAIYTGWIYECEKGEKATCIYEDIETICLK